MWWSLLLLCVAGALGHYAPDEVLSLPGLSTQLNFRQWSGYLQASTGKHLHYWFVTSQLNPLKDPVILWLNGGPGCSSLDGFLSENGPLHVNDDGSTLYINEYSWNKVANVLYLESPAGVGFSYSDDKVYTTNDDEVAENNYLALQDFFSKFPNFTGNDFYVIGESYGGIYTPTLSLKIANGPAKINFKLKEVFMIIYNSGLNVYSLYMDCAGGIQRNNMRFHRDVKNLFQFYQFEIMENADDSGNLVPPCINGTAQRTWINHANVRKALHIPENVQSWELCSSVVGDSYQRIYNNMQDFYLKLLSKGLRVLVYNGDTDMACNFLGDNWFVQSLKQKKTLDYQPWTYNKQIAGFYEQYGNLTFLTIKGAGHMVPQWAPARALKMFESFLSNSAY
ncbi:lysosomal protective protein-like isoform X2 [Scyliorhinus torazame]|uniref:lysosomal protective protein-like isoform X2 n=1 Tax=Scyliorhinus torazame TaxID=75743 RepID=UPI003B5A75AE